MLIAWFGWDGLNKQCRMMQLFRRCWAAGGKSERCSGRPRRVLQICVTRIAGREPRLYAIRDTKRRRTQMRPTMRDQLGRGHVCSAADVGPA